MKTGFFARPPELICLLYNIRFYFMLQVCVSSCSQNATILIKEKCICNKNSSEKRNKVCIFNKKDKADPGQAKQKEPRRILLSEFKKRLVDPKPTKPLMI